MKYVTQVTILMIFMSHDTLSEKLEETTNADSSSNCNFAEEISKLRNELVGNFHDLRDEIMEVKLVIIKNL